MGETPGPMPNPFSKTIFAPQLINIRHALLGVILTTPSLKPEHKHHLRHNSEIFSSVGVFYTPASGKISGYLASDTSLPVFKIQSMG